ncbi:MAG: PAS domain S-box protein [Nanoarchaeota archaeon]|nr:PAS domain S-box protein [Nanoarchaeota archaeon]
MPEEEIKQEALLNMLEDLEETKKKLEESQRLYRLITDNATDHIALMKLDTTYVYLNAANQQLGYKPGELVGKKGIDFVHPDDRKKLVPILMKYSVNLISNLLKRQKNVYEKFQYRFPDKSGKWHDMEGIATPVPSPDGKGYNILLVSRDITERNKSEGVRREEQARFKGLFDNMSSGVAVYEPVNNCNDFIFKDLNLSGEIIDGIKKKDVVGKNLLSVFPGAKEFGILGAMRKVCKTGESQHLPINKYTDPRIKGWRENFLFKLPTGEVVAVYNDVTEKMETQEELQKLAAIPKYTTELINIADLKGQMIFLNNAGSRMLGISSKDVNNHNILEVIPDPLKDIVKKELLPALMNRKTWEGDLQYKNIKTGKLTDVHSITFTIKDQKTGKPLYLANVSRDITEKKKAEQEIKDSEERFRIAFDYAPIGYYISDSKGAFIEGNKKAEEIIGYKRKDLLGKNYFDVGLISKESLPLAAKILAKNVMGKATGPDEFVLNRKDGKKIILEVWTYPIKMKGNRVVLGIVNDITEKKMVEGQIKEKDLLFKDISDKSFDIVYILDRTGKVTYVNNAIRNILGYNPKEVIGINFKSIVSKSEFPSMKNVFISILKGKSVKSIRTKLKNNKGKEVDILFNSSPLIKEGKIIGTYGIIRKA